MRASKTIKLTAIIITAAWLAVVVFYYQQSVQFLDQVIFLDVGQGDSILIKTADGQTVLIDGGPDRAVLNALSPQLPWWDKQIDLMVLTHPHADHLAGLNYVLDNYRINKIIITGVNHSSVNYSVWLAKIKAQNIPLEIMDSQRAIALGSSTSLGTGCQLQFLYPLTSVYQQTVDNLNNSSIVSRLQCGQVSWLLPGDLENGGEAELLASGAELQSTVLKIGHHGSDNATGDAWLQAVKPQIAVISLGQKNHYGFPHQATLNKLQQAGVEVLRTDRLGTIKLLTDGQTVWRK